MNILKFIGWVILVTLAIIGILALCVWLMPDLEASEVILTASWYSIQSLKDEGTWKTSRGRMANGKLFNENAFTCASYDFPLKTKLQVTNIENPEKSVIVEVTDKIHKRFKGKRIDLSKAAFQAILCSLEKGLCKVKVKELK